MKLFFQKLKTKYKEDSRKNFFINMIANIMFFTIVILTFNMIRDKNEVYLLFYILYSGFCYIVASVIVGKFIKK
ncbi:hypothetical protein COL41_02690 [Bacillus mycoides]|nr:hypothetical protein COL41_02690 [Bacillus mycoides]QWH77013.1 hypothetical protein EXW59_10155 [Bacillus mycoides]QWI42063.1 hypothetical protein EXW55_03410 [Bacillus mycoides]